uniref:Uncharacterized protein n=1 Tax=Oryza brachyantha TaxID=4533 RepID=J3L6Q4_ORYBR
MWLACSRTAIPHSCTAARAHLLQQTRGEITNRCRQSIIGNLASESARTLHTLTDREELERIAPDSTAARQSAASGITSRLFSILLLPPHGRIFLACVPGSLYYSDQ